jgi:type IV secretory pathway VirB4 component
MEGKNFGEYTLSVVIYDEDRLKVDSALAEFQKLFTQHDGLLYEERYNLLNAFFATVPGNRQFNLRKQWALNSNYADLSFLFTVDTGSNGIRTSNASTSPFSKAPDYAGNIYIVDWENERRPSP